MDREIIFRSQSVDDTLAIGENFAREELHPGSLVVLRGELGAGKTQFTKGIARWCGLDVDDVGSPTYSLVNEFDVRINGSSVKLFHLDCYRFEKPSELLELGVEEYLYPKQNMSVIEWPERIESFLPKGRIEVIFETLSPNERKISIHIPSK